MYFYFCFITSLFSGNTNNQFTLWRLGVDPPSLATTQNFQYDAFQRIQEPITFQLLIEVTDELGGNKASQLSATITGHNSCVSLDHNAANFFQRNKYDYSKYLVMKYNSKVVGISYKHRKYLGTLTGVILMFWP